MYKNITLEGGGIKGIAYLSAFETLSNAGLVNSLEHYYGASAGAIFAGMLVASNNNINELKEIINRTDFSDLKDDSIGFLRDTFRLYNTYGICRGEKLEAWYYEVMRSLTNIGAITFNTLYKLTGKHLHVVVTNLSKGRTELLGTSSTPSLEVCKAIRISASIPIFYVPVIYNNMLYVDGGLLCNFFVPGKDTIGLHLTGDTDFAIDKVKKIKGLPEYIKSLIDVMMFNMEQRYVDKDTWENTVNIKTGKIKTTDFNLTERQRCTLYKNGKLAAEKFIKKKAQEHNNMVKLM